MHSCARVRAEKRPSHSEPYDLERVVSPASLKLVLDARPQWFISCLVYQLLYQSAAADNSGFEAPLGKVVDKYMDKYYDAVCAKAPQERRVAFLNYHQQL